jgi:hypothetical protein
LSEVAQWLQNRAYAALSVPHFEQRIGFPLATKRLLLFSLYHRVVGSDQRAANLLHRINSISILEPLKFRFRWNF